MIDAVALNAWIDHIFGNRRAEKGYASVCMAVAFERADESLARFSDEALNEGFWYLFDNSEEVFFDEQIPRAIRLRALRSFVPLFEKVMAPRCSPHLSHLNESAAGPLNSACYMWFDVLLDRFSPGRIATAGLDSALLVVLRDILAIPHDACRESALHGIGHWVRPYPHFAGIIDDFLSCTSGLRPELIAYAESARAGCVL